LTHSPRGQAKEFGKRTNPLENPGEPAVAWADQQHSTRRVWRGILPAAGGSDHGGRTHV